MTCPPPVEDLHPVAPAEQQRVARFLEHASECLDCGRAVGVLRRLDGLMATLVRGPRDFVGPCPDPEALVTWLSGERSVARRLELHLVACSECREDILAASLASGWTRAVAAVSTRRMRLSSARLYAQTSRRLRLDSQDDDDEPETPTQPRRRQGGVGLLALVFALSSLFLAAAASRPSLQQASHGGSGGSMSTPGLARPPGLSNTAAGATGRGPVEDGRP